MSWIIHYKVAYLTSSTSHGFASELSNACYTTTPYFMNNYCLHCIEVVICTIIINGFIVLTIKDCEHKRSFF